MSGCARKRRRARMGIIPKTACFIKRRAGLHMKRAGRPQRPALFEDAHPYPQVQGALFSVMYDLAGRVLYYRMGIPV